MTDASLCGRIVSIALPMKATLLLSSLLAVVPVIAFGAAEKSAPPKAGAAQPQPARRHPLRGVITAVHADKSALMIKHEDIPGVMRAMTMLFRVDDATLKAAKPGQAITGMMARENDEWWLHDAKLTPVPAK
jgi:Cu/Ag efflux protein CusF